jgi:hypothetical protein
MKRTKRTLIYQKLKKQETAIKYHCYQCNGDRKKVDCEISDCPLYQLRPFGKHSKKDK